MLSHILSRGTLTNATGNDIRVADTAVANTGNVTVQKMVPNITTGVLAASGASVSLAADTTADNSITSGYVTLDSDKSFAVDNSTVVVTDVFVDASSTLKKVANLDVTSVIKATDALKTVDSALSFISGERAKLGALQSRFDTTIANLQVTSENLTASRSRILDADFAAETAALSRAQNITVTPPSGNFAPVANNDFATTTMNTAVSIPVLANDTDADGTLDKTSVTLVSAPTKGGNKVWVNPTYGGIRFIPGTGFRGTDTFTYTVKDNLGAVSNIATVQVNVN